MKMKKMLLSACTILYLAIADAQATATVSGGVREEQAWPVADANVKEVSSTPDAFLELSHAGFQPIRIPGSIVIHKKQEMPITSKISCFRTAGAPGLSIMRSKPAGAAAFTPCGLQASIIFSHTICRNIA